MVATKKRCPKGSRKNKNGDCIPYKKGTPVNVQPDVRPSIVQSLNMSKNGLPFLSVDFRKEHKSSGKKLRAKRAVNKLLGYL
jgi:hypothetical protein